MIADLLRVVPVITKARRILMKHLEIYTEGAQVWITVEVLGVLIAKRRDFPSI